MTNTTLTATVTDRANGQTYTDTICNTEQFNMFYESEVIRFPAYEDKLWFMEQLAKATKSVVSGEMIANGFSMLPTPDAEAVIEYSFKIDVAFNLADSFDSLLVILSKLSVDEQASIKAEVSSTIRRTRTSIQAGTATLSALDNMLRANARGYGINIENGNIKAALEDAMIWQALKPLIAMAEAKAEAERMSLIVEQRFINKLNK